MENLSKLRGINYLGEDQKKIEYTFSNSTNNTKVFKFHITDVEGEIKLGRGNRKKLYTF